ncbi:peptidylprolyl isomerase [Oleomonas cavernae]|uniref:Parvulin-like PPIase n=1 Tax=Oleomonas cavernae TaxID=2320859 RepID=A0A418W996_9PROT|nr:peptidylprolyl isomerase [Oleomonas cavernae]RJF86546.1 peptidylprolyl isomerase [Oleomonas cavernae]
MTGVAMLRIATLAVLMVAALPLRAQDAGAEVVARVGSVDITAAEVQAMLEGLPAQQREALAKDPALLGQTLRQLLATRLLYAEALARKWDQKPEVAAAIERARQGVVIENYLRSVAEPPADFPGDADIASAYEANKTSFLVPRQYRLAQIFIALPKGADKPAEEAARKKLDAVQARLKEKGADFAVVAAKLSDEDAARGEIGWVRDDAIRPEIRDQVAGLPKDGISEPVRLDDGWHIVKLLDTKAAYTRPIAEVRAELVAALRRERAAADAQAYLARLLQANPAAINELALSRLLVGPGR